MRTKGRQPSTQPHWGVRWPRACTNKAHTPHNDAMNTSKTTATSNNSTASARLSEPTTRAAMQTALRPQLQLLQAPTLAGERGANTTNAQRKHSGPSEAAGTREDKPESDQAHSRRRWRLDGRTRGDTSFSSSSSPPSSQPLLAPSSSSDERRAAVDGDEEWRPRFGSRRTGHRTASSSATTADRAWGSTGATAGAGTGVASARGAPAPIAAGAAGAKRADGNSESTPRGASRSSEDV